MVRYKAVIFDLFGTLIPTVTPDDYAAMLVTLASALNVEPEAFTKAWRAMIDERESGLLGDMNEILGKTTIAAGREASAIEISNAKRHWLSIAAGWLAPRADARATLESIRNAGVKTGLLSNCSAEIPILWPGAGLADLFDQLVFSCNVGTMKPHPSVYEASCRTLGVKPEQCMFVGDGGARELTGANAIGMKAVLLRVPGEEHTWFDNFYRKDALEWPGAVVANLSDLPSMA